MGSSKEKVKNKVKGKKKYIITMIVCFIFTASLLFIAFWVITVFESPTNEENTIELKATFERVEKEKKDYYIFVDEYKCRLMLNSAVVVDDVYLMQIKKGESIYFRIYKSAQNFLNDTSIPQLVIVTVKTAENDIATLESFKKSGKEAGDQYKNRRNSICDNICVSRSLLYIEIKRYRIFPKENKKIVRLG